MSFRDVAGEAVYKLNEASVCRFYAELLLRTANKVVLFLQSTLEN